MRNFHSSVLASVMGWLPPTLGCNPAAALPTPSADAARWFDVSLPDAVPSDGFLLTQVTIDGTLEVVDPNEACPESDAGAGVDAATFGAPDFDASTDADAGADADASDGATGPVGPACPKPPGPGDLIFDEVMIASEPGSDDRGQWLEVRSTKTCSLDLLGLTATAPHGQSSRTLEVGTDVWLPPLGFFVIADSLDPSENNSLPGLALAWSGSPADALHKTSDTITLSLGSTTVDTLSYPDKTRVDGTSLAFPATCDARLRSDFANWVPSVASWTPGFFGTPNAPNTDVTCAVASIPTCSSARRGPRRRSR
jgi:hypothetical protein